nr:MAG TPA: hypothetical protein [Caudoviricetes sp.]
MQHITTELNTHFLQLWLKCGSKENYKCFQWADPQHNNKNWLLASGSEGLGFESQRDHIRRKSL